MMSRLVVRYHQHKNWGDRMSPRLVELFSGQPVDARRVDAGQCLVPHFIVMGSILRFANRFTKVWGAGFISTSAKCSEPPAAVYAVRGPLTRKKLLESGIPCPEVYGDPAILMPQLIRPVITAKYRLGLIPHYVDFNDWRVAALAQRDDVLLIDITSDKVIESICECGVIASSSLHGIILADVYGTPVTWLRITGQLYGDNFKFLDWFAASGREWSAMQPFQLDLPDVDVVCDNATYPVSMPEVSRLREACPFRPIGDRWK